MFFRHPGPPATVPLIPGITRCGCSCHGYFNLPDDNGILVPNPERPIATHEEEWFQHGGKSKVFRCDGCWEEQTMAYGMTLIDWLEWVVTHHDDVQVL